MTTTVTPFLMFQNGDAEAALTFYVSLFPDSAVTDIKRYGPGEAGPEGTVFRASFRLAGQTVACIDSPVKHAFAFTPSFSFFVDSEAEPEFERLAAALTKGGEVLMAPADYGFSRRFTWVNDRFGVSWQINLP